jgi:glycosidase
VASQVADPDSVLSCYRRILAVRRESTALQVGSLGLLRTVDPTVLGYRRVASDSEALVLIAFGPDEASVTLPGPRRARRWQAMTGTHRDRTEEFAAGARLTLRPFEAIVAMATAD